MICRISRKVAYIETYWSIFFGKKPSEAKISREPNMKKPRKNVLLDVRLKRNWLVHIWNANSNKQFLVIFMRKWVYTVFQQDTKYDKTVYMENERFLTHRSIYIWNLLFKSFQMICRIISITCLQQKWDIQIFWKQLFQGVISAQSKIGKGQKNVVFFYLQLKRKRLVPVKKSKCKINIFVIFLQKWV